ncbi:MAG TPA: helix-turn-helix domain-containing protein [Casimicrobiaceae bacterium]|nr:helix-turn-helix domain-containing protein [Casimicrobiaceae bacterium]
MNADIDGTGASAAATISAGATLRNARESLGLTIDAVSQQLKLAPRQVQALEADDFAQLPGRTFVRGFMRNYARLLRLDADAVLASLPEASAAPSLDRPSLTSTTRAIGELPADLPSKPSSARWAIPLALVAIVAIAAAYEFGRPLAERGRAALAERTAAPATPAPVAAPEPAAAPASPPAEQTAQEPPPQPETVPAAPATDTAVVFVFRGTSWIEVKDAKGAVVLSTMGYPGATHAVGGALPLDVVLGNAEAVVVSVRGAPFDTTPFVKQNVAKFQVK